MTETPLQMAQRHVDEQRALLESQRALVDRLVKAGQPAEAAELALREAEATLARYEQDLERLSTQS
jgi:hypothetical protein